MIWICPSLEVIITDSILVGSLWYILTAVLNCMWRRRMTMRTRQPATHRADELGMMSLYWNVSFWLWYQRLILDLVGPTSIRRRTSAFQLRAPQSCLSQKSWRLLPSLSWRCFYVDLVSRGSVNVFSFGEESLSCFYVVLYWTLAFFPNPAEIRFWRKFHWSRMLLPDLEKCAKLMPIQLKNLRLDFEKQFKYFLQCIHVWLNCHCVTL